MLWRGMYPEVLAELKAEPSSPTNRNSFVRLLTLESAAHARMQEYPEAMRELDHADRLCADSPEQACGEVLRAHGVVADQQGDTQRAQAYFQQSLAFARTHRDRLLEATALLNLGAVALEDQRLDEAVDWSDAAYRAAASLDALDLAQAAAGNLGSAYYKLGDSERALESSLSAQNDATQLSDQIAEMVWARHAGRIFADLADTARAAQSYRKALDLAEKSHASDEIYNVLLSMSWLALQTGSLDDAAHYADRALQVAKAGNKHLDELYPRLVQGQIAARRGDLANARQTYGEIEHDKDCPVSLKWEAQHFTAQLYESEKQVGGADREYRTALATFETARADVRHEDFQLSFLTNGAHIYDDYVHFLVAQGKTEEALRWADYSRARTLLEGLGLLNKHRPGAEGTQLKPPTVNPRSVAARASAAVLYYWLGEKQSYLWAITPKQTRLFTLPPGAEIETAAERYRKAVTGLSDVLESANEDGQRLYRTLILPVQSLLPKSGRVVVIPDGKLNNLNFDTLISPAPAPHYWIEDAVIANASSLRVLAASHNAVPKRNRRKLLLIGNSIAPNEQYPALPNAQAQMDSVARHFLDRDRQIIAGPLATPASYLASHPEQFSHIHFVAHGTASRLSPLDSAIILSRDPAEADSFKLYARNIILHPLRADLVTISACSGAGERSYSGEGLVGLAWAFLRAGSHNVIAALWDVTDASTERLMDRFYDELEKGSSPDAALRAAKLSLLHGGTFRNPYYWAPFQLYSGS